jgi:hypothetical protein
MATATMTRLEKTIATLLEIRDAVTIELATMRSFKQGTA